MSPMLRGQRVFLFVCVLGLLLTGVRVFGDDLDSSPTRLDDEELKKFIDDLDSPHWRIREQATQVIMGQGPEVYEPLRKALRRNPDHEVRNRIKRIIREIYVTDALGPEPAFLGIQHTGRAERTERVSRVPAGSSGILIDRVFPATAADRAGLRPGDLVLSLDGERATGGRHALEFTSWIGAQRVGTRCRVGVLRGGDGINLNRKQSPRFSPRAFSKIETRVLGHEDDPRIPKGNAGILITDVAKADSALKLADGDLLIALDGQPIPLDGAEQTFLQWTRDEPLVGVPAPQPVEKVDRIVPSAQILRGGKWIEFDVILGRRPDYLSDRVTSRGASRAKAVDEITSSFEVWWDEWLRSGGMAPGRFDADAYWLLEP